MKTDWEKHVVTPGPLQQLLSNTWVVDAPVSKAIRRSMVIHKLPSGGLLLHSVIALTESGMKQVENLGKPEFMVVPCALHRMDAAVYKDRYPGIQVLCPSFCRKKVEERVKVDAHCEDVLPQLGIHFEVPDGLKDTEFAYLLEAPEGKALVVADCLMNLPRVAGFEGFVFYQLGSLGFFGLTLIGRLLLLKNRKAFGEWLSKMAALPKLKVIAVAHGDPVTENVSQMLESARRRLKV